MMALCSFLRQGAEVINLRFYLPAKPKPLSKILLNTCINLKQKKMKNSNRNSSYQESFLTVDF